MCFPVDNIVFLVYNYKTFLKEIKEMKKTATLNIIFKIFTLALLAYFITYAIIHMTSSIKQIKLFEQIIETENLDFRVDSYKDSIERLQGNITHMIISCVCSITLFLFVWFKDLQIISSSLIKTIKDHSNANKEKKTQEKIEKLQAQQAQIETQINELKGGK